MTSQKNIMDDIKKEIFDIQNDYLEINEIIQFWENNDNIGNYLNIEIDKLYQCFEQINYNFKIKVIKELELDHVILLLKNKMIDLKIFWENKFLSDNLLEVIKKIKEHNMLEYFILNLEDSGLIDISSILPYYLLNDFYLILKNTGKLFIFLNAIRPKLLNQFLVELDTNILDKLSIDINYLQRLEIMSYLMDLINISDANLTNLELVLCIKTNLEYNVRQQFTKLNYKLLTNILPLLSLDTFEYIINNVSKNKFINLLLGIRGDKLKAIFPNIDNFYIPNVISKLDFNQLKDVFCVISLQQLQNTIIDDQQLPFLISNISESVKQEVYDLLNNTPPIMIQAYLSSLNTTIILILFNYHLSKYRIINNYDAININTLTILVNIMSSDELINLLLKFDIDICAIFLSNVNNELHPNISKVIDNQIKEIDDTNRLLISRLKLCDEFLDLNLSKSSALKLKNLITINV